MSQRSFNFDATQKIDLNLVDAEVIYFPNFIPTNTADAFYRIFLDELAWRQDDIKLFGKTYPQPRLTALYASNKQPYSYSNITMTPLAFTKELLAIKEKIEVESSIRFTTCLANLYRTGQDSNGWHADDERELGQNPVIASVSFGATRKFKLRLKRDHSVKCDLELTHGSLLLMKGKTQHFWQHHIPKTKREVDPRINLTYRRLH